MQPANAQEYAQRFLRPGAWFWIAIVVGAAIRLYLVIFTEGTYDVAIWKQHAAGVHNLGLIGCYRSNPAMNHPPFISVAVSLLLQIADKTGIPFRILLRAPFALLDAGTALLLLKMLRPSRWRFAIAAGYWLNPLSIIFSAYHGNTDSAVAFFLLICVYLLSKENIMAAGAALGISLWIKLPGMLAIGALFFFVQGWRKRLLFIVMTGIAASITFLPAVFRDAQAVYANVFGYRGQVIQTTKGMPVWGPRALIFAFLPSPRTWPVRCIRAVNFFLVHSWLIAAGLFVLLAWLRRSRRSASEVCATIAAGYAIVYGFTDYWSFQYLAWSLPFWYFLRPWFFISATVLAGSYIYSLYWFLCGNPLLLGTWDFAGRPDCPTVVIFFRTAAILFFFFSGWVFLISAIKERIAWLSTPHMIRAS